MKLKIIFLSAFILILSLVIWTFFGSSNNPTIKLNTTQKNKGALENNLKTIDREDTPVQLLESKKIIQDIHSNAANNSQNSEIPPDFMPHPEPKTIKVLPEDLNKQLNTPPPELPEDLKSQLEMPQQDLPPDIKDALKQGPRKVSIEEVNGTN